MSASGQPIYSGDLYTSITTSRPSTVHVGEFTRVFAFIDTRAGGDVVAISDPALRGNVTEQLTVAAVTGGTNNDIIGVQMATSADAAGEMKFRENYHLPLRDEVGNAVGALFAASAPGTYRLHAGNELTDEGVVMAGFASVGDLASRTLRPSRV